MTILKKIIFLMLFFIMLGYLYLDFLGEDYFKIKNIEVNKGLVLLDGEIHNSLLTLKGKNIWDIDVKKISEELKKDVRIKEITITKIPPSKLQVSIEEEKPFVKVKMGEKVFITNDKGEIFSYSKELDFNDLVLLNANKAEDIKELILIVKNIEDKELLSFVSEIYKEGNEIRLLLNDGVYIKTDTTVDKKRYELAKKLYKKLKNDGTEILYIDIRFEDYIVKKALGGQVNEK